MRKFMLALLLPCLFTCPIAAWSQGAGADQTVTVPKSDLEELKSKVVDLQNQVDQLKPGQAPGGRALALPDISLVGQAVGKLSSDGRDGDGSRILLRELELGIQGYVYPQLKADAFITASPAENEPAQVEEAYLTYLGLTKGLNLYVGKKHAAFGRTNLLHSHSWPYVSQPLVIQNLVAGESLTGQGAELSYVIPTRGDLFLQLDAGAWSFGGEGEGTDPAELDTTILRGPGANLTDRFQTARLWASLPLGEDQELELGGSYAGGSSRVDGTVITVPTNVTLHGLDLSYRRFGEGDRRLLLRGEYFTRRQTSDLEDGTVSGYYLFGNYRWDKYNSLGLLYDWSGFPQAPDLHESAISLIYTRQFTEQYYMRLQGTLGSRPGSDNYGEVRLLWVWGVGPHTHNLE